MAVWVSWQRRAKGGLGGGLLSLKMCRCCCREPSSLCGPCSHPSTKTSVGQGTWQGGLSAPLMAPSAASQAGHDLRLGPRLLLDSCSHRGRDEPGKSGSSGAGILLIHPLGACQPFPPLGFAPGADGFTQLGDGCRFVGSSLWLYTARRSCRICLSSCWRSTAGIPSAPAQGCCGTGSAHGLEEPNRTPMLISFPSGSSSSDNEIRAPWQKKLMEQLSNVPKTGRNVRQDQEWFGDKGSEMGIWPPKSLSSWGVWRWTQH